MRGLAGPQVGVWSPPGPQALGLFVLLGLHQGIGMLTPGEDWSDRYSRAEATVEGSFESKWPGSTLDNPNRL